MHTKDTPNRPDGVWRRVDGSDIHWVSSDGRVWSDKMRRLLKPTQRPDGYYVVNLGGNDHPLRVHRLVARAFHGEPEPGQEVRHLNGCPTDNRVENLSWGTHTENVHDILAHRRNVNANKTHCPQGHPYDEANTRTWLVKGRPRRFCRACDNIRSRKRYQSA